MSSIQPTDVERIASLERLEHAVIDWEITVHDIVADINASLVRLKNARRQLAAARGALRAATAEATAA